MITTENNERNIFQLETTARYSHSKKYIEKLCEKYNYSINHFSWVNLRKEKDAVLTGGIYMLDF